MGRSLVDQGIRTGQGDYWVRTGFAKVFIDGTLGDGTAAMFEPFTDNPDSRGIPMMTQQELDDLVLLADRNGLQVGVHAIGDQGSDMVLNAYEKAALVNGRHDMRFAETRVGIDRCKTAYAWRSLLDSGAVLSFRTDWSVEPLDPMRGVFSAVTRTNIQRMEPKTGWFPEQKLTVWEAINYYTWGSAYGEHLEGVKGTLAPGRLADLVVMDRDLFTIPPEEILKAQVDVTITGGRVVWDRAKGEWNGGLD